MPYSKGQPSFAVRDPQNFPSLPNHVAVVPLANLLLTGCIRGAIPVLIGQLLVDSLVCRVEPVLLNAKEPEHNMLML